MVSPGAFTTLPSPTMHMGFDAVRWPVRWNTTGEFTRFLFPQGWDRWNEVVYTAIDLLGRVWCATLERGVSVYDGRNGSATIPRIRV